MPAIILSLIFGILAIYLASSLNCDPKQLKCFTALTLLEPNLHNTESGLLQLIVWPSSKFWNKIKLILRINRKLKSTNQLYSQAYQNLLIYIWPMKNSAINLALLWNLFWEKHYCWDTKDRTSIKKSWLSRIILNAWSLLILIRHPVR